MRYEYKVLPAPEKGDRVKGAKGAGVRFAAALERIMNELGTEGWEYVRSDTLPSEERSGLGQSTTVWRNLLVFRRPHAEDAAQFRPKLLEPPRGQAVPLPSLRAGNDPQPPEQADGLRERAARLAQANRVIR